jgi:competence protein ComEA
MKRVLFALTTLVAAMSVSFAAIDVNKASAAELDSIKGIGPAMSKRIIDERSVKGSFKDWSDFDMRVKGIGEKSSIKLSSAGLTVNGQAMANAPATKPVTAPATKPVTTNNIKKDVSVATTTTGTTVNEVDAKAEAKALKAKALEEKKALREAEKKAKAKLTVNETSPVVK